MTDFRSADSDLYKVALCNVLTAIVESGGLHNEDNRRAIETAMLREVKHQAPFVRLCAIIGLAKFDDVHARKAIRDAASSDPYIVNHDGFMSFPVRDEAKALLQQQGKQ